MNKLVVTTLESRIRVFDMRTQHPTGKYIRKHLSNYISIYISVC